jgi:hypothetical protein
MINGFAYGERVHMRCDVLPFQKRRVGTVVTKGIGKSIRRGCIRVLLDGQRQATTFHADFFQRLEATK